MKKVLLLCSLFIYTVSSAQYLNFSWARGFGAPNTIGNAGVTGINIATDATGNIYLAGTFQDTVDFDPSPSTYFLSSAAQYDVFVMKLDVNGNMIWTKPIAGMEIEGPVGINIDASGNVYVLGVFKAMTDFNPDPVATFNLTPYGLEDIFLLKLNASGDFVWAEQFGGTSSDRPTSLAIDQNNNLLIGGYFEGTADFDPSASSLNLTSNGGSDGVIVKVNAAGTLQWAHNFGSTQMDYLVSLKADATGNILSTGSFLGTVDFDPGAASTSLTVPANTYGTFIMKSDTAGNLTWVKAFMPEPFAHVSSSTIALDNFGNIFISGYFDHTIDFNTSPGVVDTVSSYLSTQDVFVARLNPSGNFFWVKTLGNSDNDYSGAVATDNNGNCYFKGSFGGQIDIDPSPTGTYSITTGGGVGTRAEYILSLNAAGTFMWGRKIAGFSAGYRGPTIHLDNQNRFYTTGQFSGTTDFDPDAGVANLSCTPGTGGGFLTQFTQGTVGINEYSAPAGFRLYPNPAHDIVRLEAAEGFDAAELVLNDVNGKMVMTMILQDGLSADIDIRNLAAGFYSLQVFNKGKTEVFKLIVE